jgi:hypothetical protein
MLLRGAQPSNELLFLEELRKGRESPVTPRARVVREPSALADVLDERERRLAARAPGAVPERVARIVPVLVHDTKEVECAPRREMDALALVQPEDVTREADVELDRGAVDTLHRERVHGRGAVGAVHGRRPDLTGISI